MKRTIVLLGLVTAFAGLTFACSSGSSDTLKDGNGGNIANANPGDDDDSTATPAPATSTTQKTTSASSVQPATAKPDAGSDPLAACDPATTTTFEACAQCCATKQPAVADLNSCACGTASKCASSCGDNFCTGGIPSIDCGICVLQAGCDFSNAETDPNASANDGEACLQQCAAKQ